MNKALVIIFLTILLDAAGLGLIFPILPSLLQHLTGDADVALLMGLLTALYALMQFLFAPVLGALSDRYGRRPVLLLSLAGMAVNYGLLAFSNSLIFLIIGRMIAGLTSANLSVASACLTDVSTPSQRTRYFGLFQAFFGAGFILGPVLGGVLGDIGLRLPFLAAALLSLANFVLAWRALPETLRQPSAGMGWRDLNPFAAFARVVPGVKILVVLFFLFSATGEAYGVCWALWGHDAFQWNGVWVGLSLGAFGLCQVLVQGFLPGRIRDRLGDRATVLTGIGCASLALTALAFSTQGWMVFAIMPLFALGSIGGPALQALATQSVDKHAQGRLQGVLASAVSLASVLAPLFFSAVYGGVQTVWPGAVWLSVLALYLLALPLVLLATRQGVIESTSDSAAERVADGAA
ncbi:TCR/Tet family MFS transporter [Thalassolituus sp. LLYu03]|uniref:TCR/Tet family MFS transporter n=1 Tax=Thalassolituus sp. LLYu03 TaxID=3421656 RepID=UPI003D2CD5F4